MTVNGVMFYWSLSFIQTSTFSSSSLGRGLGCGIHSNLRQIFDYVWLKVRWKSILCLGFRLSTSASDSRLMSSPPTLDPRGRSPGGPDGQDRLRLSFHIHLKSYRKLQDYDRFLQQVKWCGLREKYSFCLIGSIDERAYFVSESRLLRLSDPSLPTLGFRSLGSFSPDSRLLLRLSTLDFSDSRAEPKRPTRPRTRTRTRTVYRIERITFVSTSK